MKIAVITTLFPSLSETFILNQITGLLDLGHDVRILAWCDPAESVVHPDVAKYNLRTRVWYIPKAPRNKLLCLLKAAGLVVSNFHRGCGPLWRFIRMFLRRKKGLSLAYVYLLLHFLDESDFDVIHCHYGPNGLIGVFLKDVGIKGTICTVFHGFDVSRYPRTHGEKVYTELFAKGDLFLPVSECWKERLINMGCPPEKTVVHRMGIDVRRFEYRERRMPSGRPVQLLTVGRLVEKKGHRYAIEAIANLVAAGRDIHYTIAGDGPLRPDLEQLAERHGLRDRVTFMGAVDQNRVQQLYRDSDVFILPSITADDGDMEGVPVVLMEAMASGIPVVSTAYAGIHELVSDGVSGLLAPEKDVACLVEKLSYLLDHPEVSQSLTKAARQHVEREFCVGDLNKRLETLFKDM